MSLQLFDEPPIVGLVEVVGLLPLPPPLLPPLLPLLPPLLPLPLPLPPERLVNLADAILLSRAFSFIAIAFTVASSVIVKGAVYLLLSAVGSVPSVV